MQSRAESVCSCCGAADVHTSPPAPSCPAYSPKPKPSRVGPLLPSVHLHVCRVTVCLAQHATAAHSVLVRRVLAYRRDDRSEHATQRRLPAPLPPGPTAQAPPAPAGTPARWLPQCAVRCLCAAWACPPPPYSSRRGGVVSALASSVIVLEMGWSRPAEALARAVLQHPRLS